LHVHGPAVVECAERHSDTHLAVVQRWIETLALIERWTENSQGGSFVVGGYAFIGWSPDPLEDFATVRVTASLCVCVRNQVCLTT
jgi:hypothetical protein